MKFDLELFKKHPYAVGGIVIVGGLIVFYLLSSKGSSSSASGDNTGAILNYDAQQAQVNAALTAQQNQTQAALAQSQLEAQVTNTQTAASLSATENTNATQLGAALAGIVGQVYQTNAEENAATAQEANQLVYAENTTSMQDAVLEDQINQGTLENANNNATALASVYAGDQLQESLGTTSLGYAYNLASQQQTNFENNVQQIIPLAGQQKNSALDATDQTAIFETALAGGNPGVASSGTGASAGVAAAGDIQNATNVGTITGGVVKLVSALL